MKLNKSTQSFWANKKDSYKTLGTSVIYSPIYPPSLIIAADTRLWCDSRDVGVMNEQESHFKTFLFWIFVLAKLF